MDHQDSWEDKIGYSALGGEFMVKEDDRCREFKMNCFFGKRKRLRERYSRDEFKMICFVRKSPTDDHGM